MKHTPPRAAALCLAATLAASAPAQADPTSLEEALANVLAATLWHAVGLPTLGGDIAASAPLDAAQGEPGGLLLTLSTPPHGTRSLTTLVWTGDRWSHEVAAEFTPGGWVALQWGAPVFVGGRRLLVVEGADLTPACGAQCPAMEFDRVTRTWRVLFVHTSGGHLRRVGELTSTSLTATLRSDGACVFFGGDAPRCWDPIVQRLRGP
ncbi:MAG: hypothetical protein U0325_20925 [Polyangiales bacterium]